MEYILTVMVLIGINVVLATSFNLILGYGGLMSVAHPIFYAIGAYCSGLLAIHLQIPVPLSILIGAAIAMVLSFGVSLPSLRVSGDYLVIASIGFQLGILHVINNLEFTGAAGGLTNIPVLNEGPSRSLVFVLLIAVVAACAVLLVGWIVEGDYGRAITAMRNDEEAFSALGRNAMNIKIVLFAIGSGMAGLAGALYAHYFAYVTPEQFGIFTSAALLTMVVVGGAATRWGPLVGAVLLTTLPQAITFLGLPVSIMAPLQGVIYTTLVIFFLFARPQGLTGGSRGGGGLEAWSASAAFRARRRAE